MLLMEGIDHLAAPLFAITEGDCRAEFSHKVETLSWSWNASQRLEFLYLTISEWNTLINF